MSSLPTKARRELGRLAADFPTEVAALWRRLAWGAIGRMTPVVAVERSGMRFFVSTKDQVIGRRFFAYPTVLEQDIVRAFTALSAVDGFDGLTDGTVVEIGANIGTHTVELITHYGAAAVVAIEPDPGNVSLLRQNLLVNGVSERATVMPVALSDSAGVMQLERSSTNHGDHRIRVTTAVTDGAELERETIDVDVTTLDALVADGTIALDRIRLVWMDTQGHESHVLAGAARVVGSSIPIVAEYWPYALRRAGGLERFHAQVAAHYDHVIDLHPSAGGPPRVLPAGRLPELDAVRSPTGSGPNR